MKTTNEYLTIYSYANELASEKACDLNGFDAAWFTVPISWLEYMIEPKWSSLDEFFFNYTYDDTEGWIQEALTDGALLGCGLGDAAHYEYQGGNADEQEEPA